MLATHLRSRRSISGHERGFTLIELLVVILILGILAGVVVFAVRGADDKGGTAARSIDRRTLRTAQEAFCARFGRYATSEAELVNPGPGTKGFISEESELHDIVPDPAGGACQGTGYRIEIQPGSPDGGDTSIPPLGVGQFTDTGTPPFSVANLVPLSSGKVFAWSAAGQFAIYDPAVPTGPQQWAAADPITGWIYSPAPSGRNAVELTDDPATGISECGLNCGKVLAFTGLQWWLFDPTAAAGLQWQLLPAPGSYSGDNYFINGSVLLEDNPATAAVDCGQHCGKVFITSDPYPDRPSVPTADLFDPKTNSFTPVPYPLGEEHVTSEAETLVVLADSRVLIAGYLREAQKVVEIWDPVTGNFAPDDRALPDRGWAGGVGDPLPPVLPNGDVLFGQADDGKEIYRPDPEDWLEADNCGEAGQVQWCEVLTQLADGRVLAHTLTGPAQPSTGRTYLYEPGPSKWTWRRVADVKVASAKVAATLLGPNAGKVLVAGTEAQLYTPPS